MGYLWNARCANATIKGSVSDRTTNRNAVTNFDAKIFTAVRNPYERILSTYLAYRNDFYNDTCIGPSLRSNFSSDQYQEIMSFDFFISFLCSFRKHLPQCLWDPHYRPQSINICHGHITPGHIFYLENFKELEGFMHENGFTMQDHRTSSDKAQNYNTHASEKINKYGDTILEKIFYLYKWDFILYGFNKDISDKGAVRRCITQKQNISSGAKLSSVFQNLVISNSCDNHILNSLRNSCKLFKNHARYDQLMKAGTQIEKEDWERLEAFYRHEGFLYESQITNAITKLYSKNSLIVASFINVNSEPNKDNDTLIFTSTFLRKNSVPHYLRN